MTFLGRRLSRRQLLAGAGTLVARGAASLSTRATGAVPPTGHEAGHDAQHGGNMAVGEVDLSRFDPSAYLTHFDYGTTSTLPDGRVLRAWKLVAFDQDIEVAPGAVFQAWTYNGQVPGPTLRCTEGDRLRIHFVNGRVTVTSNNDIVVGVPSPTSLWITARTEMHDGASLAFSNVYD